MKVLLTGSLLLAASLGVGSAFAGELTGPTEADLNKSTSRGLYTEPVHPVMPHVNVISPTVVRVPISKSVQTVSKTHTITKHQKVTNVASVKNPVKMVSATSEASIVNNSEHIITAWLDKEGVNPAYKNREKMQVNVRAARDCNLMVFDFDGQGKLTQIFPNDYQQNSLVRAGETISIGGKDSPFEYQVSIPKGQSKTKESIFVYAYPANEAPLSIAMSHLPNAPFRGAEMNIEQYRKLVNQSKVYFSRGINIIPKQGAKLISSQSIQQSPNKVELSFLINQ